MEEIKYRSMIIKSIVLLGDGQRYIKIVKPLIEETFNSRNIEIKRKLEL